MKYFTKCICIVLLAFFFVHTANSQCPGNPKELIINTQEKYDNFFKNYPNCKEYEIYMVNGKFIGDPKPKNYIISLLLILAGILVAMKLVIVKFNLK